MSVASFFDLFGGYVQEGMLVHDEDWDKRMLGTEGLSNPQGDIAKREDKLPKVFSAVLRTTVKVAFGVTDSVVHLWKAYLCLFKHGMWLNRMCLPKWGL